MDPITHGLLGAATSQSLFTRQLSRKAWLIGAAAAMAPDLDIFVHSATNPMLGIYFHRYFTHAFLFIPIGGVIVALLALLLIKSWRPKWLVVILASIIAYGTHGLLDASTTYGTQLLWPFSNARIAWDIIAIVDPVFTVILAVGVLVSAWRVQAKPAVIALILALAYLGFGTWQHHRAISEQQQIAQVREDSIVQGRVTPTLGTLLTWRSFYIAGDQIYIDRINTPLFGRTEAIGGGVAPWLMLSELPVDIKMNPTLLGDFELFSWFSDDYVAVFSQQPLIVVDARYVLPSLPLKASWGIEFPNFVIDDQIQWLHGIEFDFNNVLIAPID